jgi:hypothetical protein
MVDSKRPSCGTKNSLNMQTAAALSVLPPAEWKPPPILYDQHENIDPSELVLRVKQYLRAYKTLTPTTRNKYVTHGIQN